MDSLFPKVVVWVFIGALVALAGCQKQTGSEQTATGKRVTIDITGMT